MQAVVASTLCVITVLNNVFQSCHVVIRLVADDLIRKGRGWFIFDVGGTP